MSAEAFDEGASKTAAGVAEVSLLEYTDRDLPEEEEEVEGASQNSTREGGCSAARFVARSAVNAMKAAQYAPRGGDLSSDDEEEVEEEEEAVEAGAPPPRARLTAARGTGESRPYDGPEADGEGEGSTDGLDSESEDRLHYATLVDDRNEDGEGGEEDFQEFQGFQEANPEASFVHSSVTTSYTTTAQVRAPTGQSAAAAAAVEEYEDDESLFAPPLPAAPPALLPKDLIVPLSAAKINTIKTAMQVRLRCTVTRNRATLCVWCVCAV